MSSAEASDGSRLLSLAREILPRQAGVGLLAEVIPIEDGRPLRWNHQPSTIHSSNEHLPPPGGQRFPVAPRKKTRTLIRSSCVLHEPGPYSAVVLIYGSTESWCGHEQDFTCAGTRIGIHLFACLAIYHQ